MAEFKSKSNVKDKRSSFAWGWMLLGIVLGFSLFTFGFVFMTERDKKFALDAMQDKIAEYARPMAEPPQLPEKKITFHFYNDLKEFNSKSVSQESLQPKSMTRIDDERFAKQQTELPAIVVKTEAPKPTSTRQRELTAKPQADSSTQVARPLAVQGPVRGNVAQAQPALPAADAPKQAIVLQVGAFRRYSEADRLRANLLAMGLNSFIQEAKVHDHIYHRVRVGPFNDKPSVDRVRQRLRAKNIDAIPLNDNRS